MNFQKWKALALQFIKFGLVGCVNTLSSLAIYYGLLALQVAYIPATVAGYLISSVLGYFLNRIWVFQARDTGVVQTAVKFYIVYGCSLFINMGSMYLWVDILHLSKYIAPILTLCLTIPFNYIFSRLWAFKKHE